MPKGAVTKSIISKKILDTFDGAFLYNDGKEIRVPIEEDGEIIQIKIALTAAKISVEPGSDNAIPTVNDITENNSVDNSIINQTSTTIVEPSEEEKQNLQNMLARLGL